ncbi:MAG: Holliday junction branch migration protein RuvA [Chitinophagales bacterium]
MIAFIQGNIVSISPTSVLIDLHGMGMEVQITLYSYEALKTQMNCKLHTYLHVKKDGQNFSGYELYGFHDTADKSLFELLLSVSGIGANTARLMLNSMTSNDMKRAILSEDERTLSSIKGLGPKTAKRLILELKDKIAKVTDGEVSMPLGQNKIKEEALLALVTLGYVKNNVIKVLNAIELKSEAKSVEDYIKMALRAL